MCTSLQNIQSALFLTLCHRLTFMSQVVGWVGPSIIFVEESLFLTRPVVTPTLIVH